MKYKISKNNIFFISVVLVVIYIYSPTRPKDVYLVKLQSELLKHDSEISKKDYAILIDYNTSIFKKRLWLIDLKTNKIVLNTHVSHAFNSGLIFANTFSNKIGSKISCKGSFLTKNSYKSQHGKNEFQIGMRLIGLDKNNNNTLKRNIVFHTSYGFWSSGCFMTYPKTNKKIIEMTRNGCLLVVI